MARVFEMNHHDIAVKQKTAIDLTLRSIIMQTCTVPFGFEGISAA